MTAIVILDQGSMELATRIKGGIADARIHGLDGRARGADETFTDSIAHVQGLFRSGEDIIGICAAGILIRALAPELGDKTTDPAVVAVSGDGRSIVPLLGGHGGGNRLALAIAEITGGHAAVTTAGDVRFGLALDDPPAGWTVANRAAAKAIVARLLADEAVALRIDCGDSGWLTRSGAPFVRDGDGVGVWVTEKIIEAPGDDLILHPPVLALGVGCERGCGADEVIGLAEKTLSDAGLAAAAVACVVSIDVKMDEAAVLDVAAHFNVPARFFDAESLEAQTPRLANPSDVVFAEVGCHGVSEGAALAATGVLLVEKQKSARATCAIGFAADGIDANSTGRARGKLTVVGIGPGADDWRTPAATSAISGATDVVGYGLYLDLIADLIRGKGRHSSDLAHEEERARKALDLSAEGRDVALVCSGDAGIYALATLVFELLDRENRDDWNRLDISVTPGVSAFQAAAARIGAPMGHDFCTISLSDLLTPFDEIEKRLRAAAAGDFVVAFYNPVSKRRTSQLARARELLLEGRGPDTPVVLARNLGRDGETLRVITLGELTADDADMLTMVVVGNSQSRHIRRGVTERVYTPRGYAKKMGKMEKMEEAI
ncbi:MAG: precorrin-3B C(17)-methyltransferase [Alphaproteobacteria bacterium]